METARKDFEAYSIGLCYASVCTSLSDEEAMYRLNRKHWTGTESPWQISDDATFVGGQPNPCPCDESPETHRHILFSC